MIDQTLKVSASGRYFETADGKPWFWLGDTAWSLLTDYTPEEARRYLVARGGMGFTLVQISPVFDGGTGTEKGDKPNPNTFGIQPWANHDPLQPNEAFWKDVDAALRVAAENGLYVGLLPTWGSNVVDTKWITLQNAKAYGRWLGARYKAAPNIVWINGGDRPFNAAPEVWRALGEGLREGDGGAHPITFHPIGDSQPTGKALQSETWSDAFMLQTWASYDNVPIAVSTDYRLTPPKPVIMGEGAYEEGPEYPTRPITPLSVRKQAWWACLSGGFYTYGHNDMWRKNPTWEKSLNSEGARNMRVLHEIFAQLDWWNLVPAQELIASGQDAGMTYHAAARARDGKWALVYFSSATTVEVKLDGLAPGLKVTWINPATGARTDAGKLGDSKTPSLTTPAGWEDGVLFLTE